MNWLNQLFDYFKPSQYSAEKRRTTSSSLQLVIAFLKNQISQPKVAVNILKETKAFSKLSEQKQLEEFPRIYLIFEQYLSEVDSLKIWNKKRLRASITKDFPDLLIALPNFALIFQKEEQQRLGLCLVFLDHVLEQSIEILGEAQNDWFGEMRLWLNSIDTPEPLSPPFVHQKTPTTNREWLDFFKLTSNILMLNIERKLGLRLTQNIFEKSYNHLYRRYSILETIPTVVSLLPEKYLDAEKINLLSKHQISSLLLDKTNRLEQANLNLERRNNELEKARNALVKSNLQTKEMLHRLSAVLQTVNEGIITVNKDSEIIMVNKQIELIFGYEEDELVGQPLTILMPRRYVESHTQGMKRYMDTRNPRVLNSTVQISGKRKNGEEFPIELNIAETNVGGITLFTAAIRDITEQLMLEKELIQSKNNLEIRVRERTEELQLARKKLEQIVKDLERSNTELEQFAYITSHDLQEPLRMIGSYTQLIQRRYKDKIGVEAEEYFGFITGGVNRMQRLIQDLLEFSRIGRINSGFQEVSLAKVLDYALKNLTSKIELTQTTIQLPENLPEIIGNQTQLIQLFQNLIGNAIKFKAPNRTPAIHIDISEKEEEWEISVKDNGIGIKDEFKQRVFIIFQRLHGRHEYDGTGVGLAICKKIVEHHLGNIWISSNENEGTTFYFTLSKNLSVT